LGKKKAGRHGDWGPEGGGRSIDNKRVDEMKRSHAKARGSLVIDKSHKRGRKTAGKRRKLFKSFSALGKERTASVPNKSSRFIIREKRDQANFAGKEEAASRNSGEEKKKWNLKIEMANSARKGLAGSLQKSRGSHCKTMEAGGEKQQGLPKKGTPVGAPETLTLLVREQGIPHLQGSQTNILQRGNRPKRKEVCEKGGSSSIKEKEVALFLAKGGSSKRKKGRIGAQ